MKTEYNDMPRPQHEVMERYRALLLNYGVTALVTDARERMGALSAGYSPVVREHKLVGPALTIGLDVDDLVDCMPVLGRARPGDVIVIAAHGSRDTAMWGSLCTMICREIGVAGALVDAAIRDVDEIRELGFPVWSLGTVPRPSPTASHDRTDPVHVNVPVIVGGQMIFPGDIVVADEVGVCIVPHADAAEVVAAAEIRAARENEIRSRIMSGASVAELVAEYGHL